MLMFKELVLILYTFWSAVSMAFDEQILGKYRIIQMQHKGFILVY